MTPKRSYALMSLGFLYKHLYIFLIVDVPCCVDLIKVKNSGRRDEPDTWLSINTLQCRSNWIQIWETFFKSNRRGNVKAEWKEVNKVRLTIPHCYKKHCKILPMVSQ